MIHFSQSVGFSYTISFLDRIDMSYQGMAEQFECMNTKVNEKQDSDSAMPISVTLYKHSGILGYI